MSAAHDDLRGVRPLLSFGKSPCKLFVRRDNPEHMGVVALSRRNKNERKRERIRILRCLCHCCRRLIKRRYDFRHFRSLHFASGRKRSGCSVEIEDSLRSTASSPFPSGPIFQNSPLFLSTSTSPATSLYLLWLPLRCLSSPLPLSPSRPNLRRTVSAFLYLSSRFTYILSDTLVPRIQSLFLKVIFVTYSSCKV